MHRVLKESRVRLAHLDHLDLEDMRAEGGNWRYRSSRIRREWHRLLVQELQLSAMYRVTVVLLGPQDGQESLVPREHKAELGLPGKEGDTGKSVCTCSSNRLKMIALYCRDWLDQLDLLDNLERRGPRVSTCTFNNKIMCVMMILLLCTCTMYSCNVHRLYNVHCNNMVL